MPSEERKLFEEQYFLVKDPSLDAVGERVVNVASATASGDAVNYGQLQTAVAELSGEVRGEMEGVLSSIAANAAAIAANAAAITANGGRIDGVASRVASVESELSAHSAALSACGTRLGNLETWQEGHETEYAALSSGFSTVSGAVEALSSAIESANQSISSLEGGKVDKDLTELDVFDMECDEEEFRNKVAAMWKKFGGAVKNETLS